MSFSYYYNPYATATTLRFPSSIVDTNPFGLFRGPYGQLYQAPFYNDNAARNRLFRDLLGEDDQFSIRPLYGNTYVGDYLSYPYPYYSNYFYSAGGFPAARPVVFGSNGTASLGGGVYLSSGL